MKLFRNPLAVGLLALVAVGLVIKSILPHLRLKPRRVAPAAAVPSPAPGQPAVPLLEKAALPAPRAGSSADTQVAVPPMAMDLDAIHADADRWAQGLRDPFQVRSMAANPIYPPAREVLFLRAVWRQTDSSLAVLNNRIYAAGDSILRYTIKSIEPDRVWVQGPNGREAVEFKSAQTTRTNLQQNPALGANVGLPKNP